MGTGSFTDQSDGEVADAVDVQQLIDAAKGDIVPRNGSGVATARAGDLGTSTFPFKNMSIADATNTYQFFPNNDGAVEVTQDGSSFFQIGKRPYTSDASNPGGGGVVRSSVINTTVSNYSSWDELASVTLTTTGRPVSLRLVQNPGLLQGTDLSDSAQAGTGGSAQSLSTYLKFGYDSTDLEEYAVSNAGHASGSENPNLNKYQSLILNLAAGTYDFKVFAQIETPSPILSITFPMNINNIYLAAFEL